MPVLPTTAYPTAAQCLTLARAVIDDAYSASGAILTGSVPGPSAPMTYPYLNAAYRFLQDELINAGIETFVKELIISPLTAAANNDPATQVILSETGYFDGATNFNPPQLPVDLLVPLRVWERPTGSLGYFTPVGEANDGLPNLSQTGKLRYWEWRQNDGLCFLGCSQSTDIRLRYDARFPDVSVDSDILQIRGATNVLAYLTAWQFAITSGDSMIADAVFGVAQKMISQMATRNARRNQRGNHRRIPWRRARGYGR